MEITDVLLNDFLMHWTQKLIGDYDQEKRQASRSTV